MRIYGVQGGTGSPNHPNKVHKAIRDARKHSIRMLVSYYYFRPADMDRLTMLFGDREVDWFADSGAFSAHTLGGEIDPVAYTEWVDRWSHLLTAVSAPDVIGDPEASMRATEAMQRTIKAVPVLPVYHVGEPLEVLQQYVKVSPYIALGGLVPYTRKRALLERWLDRTFEFIPAHTQVHGFGMTTWDLVKKYPWYSVDSSSWSSVFRYAALQLFDPVVGVVTIDLRSKTSVLENLPLLRSYGLKVSDLTHKSLSTDPLIVASLEAWWRVEDWFAERRQSIRQYAVCASCADSSQASPQRVVAALKGAP